MEINVCGTGNMPIIKIGIKRHAWNNIEEEMGTPRNIIEAKMHNIRSH
jgi:hypothetical protein